MSNKQREAQDNLGAEGLLPEDAGQLREQDAAADTAAEARATPSASGTGSIKVTG